MKTKIIIELDNLDSFIYSDVKDELDNDYIDPFLHPYKQDAIEYLEIIDNSSITPLLKS